MERITNENHKDLGFVVYEGTQKPYNAGLTVGEIAGFVTDDYSPRKILEEVFARLAAYEDTGLEPEEITDLQRVWGMCGGEEGITNALQKVDERDAAVEELRGICWCCAHGKKWDKAPGWSKMTTCEHMRELGALARSGGKCKCPYWKWRGPQKAPVNTSLTLDELLEMDGEQVWIDQPDGSEDCNGWARVELAAPWKPDGPKPHVLVISQNGDRNYAGLLLECGGKIYRNKPEEGGPK